MLELIFQGFIEWLYGLVLESWSYFSSSLLDVMSLDFAYLRAHIPVIDPIMQILLAVGWALLLGNLVFQALKSMASGLGFDGEDPRLLFARTFVFAFLLLASPQICEIVMTITSRVIALLEIPDAVNVTLVDEAIFGTLGAAWLLVIIFGVIIMFKVLKLILEIAERYVILAMLTITAPLAFVMGGSRNTSEIFTGWCRMYGSMSLLMATHVIFFKMLLSVLSTLPTGLDVIPWMVLIISIVKVAKKADEIITRIGLNPAITGAPLGGSRLPGMLAYTVIRTAASQVTKTVAASIGGNGHGASPSTPPGGSGPQSGGPAGGRTAWGGRTAGKGSAYYQGGSRQTTSQQTSQQGAAYQGDQQSTTQQAASQQNTTTSRQTTAQQTSSRQYNAAQNGGQHSASQSQTVNSSASSQQTAQNGGAGQGTRKTYVPPGARRSASYVNNSSGGSSNPQTRQNIRQTRETVGSPGQTSGAPAGAQPNAAPVQGASQPAAANISQTAAPAGKPPRNVVSGGTAGGQPNAAGTGTRSTQATARTDVHGGSTSSAAQTTTVQNGAASSQPRAGVASSVEKAIRGTPTVGASAPKPGSAGTGTRSTQAAAQTGTPKVSQTTVHSDAATANQPRAGITSSVDKAIHGTPTVGASAPKPGPAGTGARSTQVTAKTGTHGGITAKPPDSTAGQKAAGTQTRSTQAAPRTDVHGGNTSSTTQVSEQNNISINQPRASTVPPSPKAGFPAAPAGAVIPGGKVGSSPKPKQGAERSTRRETPDAAPQTAPAATHAPTPPGVSQAGTAGTRSTARPAGVSAEQRASTLARQESRPAPAAAKPTTEGSSHSSARQEPHPAPTTTRAAADGPGRSTARQEQGAVSVSSPPPVKGGGPVIHPGTAGTAPEDRQTAQKGRTAGRQPQRAQPAASATKGQSIKSTGHAPKEKPTRSTAKKSGKRKKG